MFRSVISAAVGLWIMISPFALNMSKNIADVNHICGPLTITFSIISMWDINRSVIKANLLVALAFIIVTLIITFDTGILISNILSAVIVIICAFNKRKRNKPYGGGWKSLFQKKPLHLKEAEK